MKVYLAGRYSRRLELCGYADELRAAGHEITSRWLDGAHQISDRELLTGDRVREGERFAREDLADVVTADHLIAFTEPPRASLTRGGRHVELGIALGLRMPVWIIGPRENVFCCLPQVSWWPTWEALIVEPGWAMRVGVRQRG